MIIHNSQSTGNIFLSIAGKARCHARSIDRLIKNTPYFRKRRCAAMKKLIKAIEAIGESWAVYAEAMGLR